MVMGASSTTHTSQHGRGGHGGRDGGGRGGRGGRDAEAAVGVVAEMPAMALKVVAALLHAPINHPQMLPREFVPSSTTLLLLLLGKLTLTTTLGSFCGSTTTGIMPLYLQCYLTSYTRHTFRI
jgi:hypothetical protein